MYALRPGEYVLKFLKIMRLGIYLVLLSNGRYWKLSKNCEKFRITSFCTGWMNSGNVGKET